MMRASKTWKRALARMTCTNRSRHLARPAGLALVLGLLAAFNANAATVNLRVVEGNCDDPAAPAVAGFRWLLQEDKTFHVEPGVQIPAAPGDPLPPSMTFHASHHPVAKATDGTGLSGHTDVDASTADIVNVPDNGHYYVSVLPYSGAAISGAPVATGVGASDVCVAVQKHPIPTAQIALFLFQDNYPINGSPDLPEEENPLPGEPGYVDWSQFSVVLEEPAGRYGQNGGPIIQDAFGNPLGTTYLASCDPNVSDCVDVLGDGTLHPDADTGTLLIKNLSPGKYGVIVNPPTGQNWQQTTTIEGTKVIDAWVKANEPSVFVEFGLPGPHVFMGFVKPSSDPDGPQLPPNTGGTAANVSGVITDMHMSRPPNFQFYSGRDFPQCWIGLNDTTVGLGRGVYASPCNADSSFAIPSVPPGNYQLKVWDSNLDVVIATLGFSVEPDGTCNAGTVPDCNFGEVPVFNWFTRMIGGIFNDKDEDGFWDANEGPVADRAVNLRWRDGSLYQSFATDGEGIAPFDEIFPFFHWLVAEVDFIDKKATGATFVVDAGGLVDKSTDAFPGYGQLTPQAQCADDGTGTGATVGYDPATDTCPAGAEADNPNTGDNLSRTETGPVLTQAVQGFLGQTSVALFGKVDYKAYDFSTLPATFIGENGGISGIVFYATTRAEDDPRWAGAETWEPGIPRVQVALYADGDIDCNQSDAAFPEGPCDIDWNGDGIQAPNDGTIYDIDQDGFVTLADVDNYPLGNFPGLEDVDRNANGVFDLGDALNVTWTDSWDDSLPTGCQGQTYYAFGDPQWPTDCFDGLRNYNQLRPGVFDGGYAIDAYDMGNLPLDIAAKLDAFYALPAVSAVGFTGLIPGDYIVATAVPPGYELLREEHKNVDFGDGYIPSTQAEPPLCVGDDHVVPDYLSMQTVPDGLGGFTPVVPVDELIPAPFAGETRPLCDRKSVSLSAAQNAAADFFLMTDVPVVANVTGGILNDLANEFNPNAPAFGEKFAPPWLPVAFYDWNGNVVNRVYADQFGKYNAVVPSTSTADRPMPSGMAPNMLVSCKNDAGPIPDGNGGFMIDPWFDPQYSQFCYTFQYMTGVATYLDTPVLPIAAFAGPGQFPVDCDRPTGTPMIASVTRAAGDGPFVLPGQGISISSMGFREVLNPEWPGVGNGKTITRDYSFGSGCGASLVDQNTGAVIALENVDCTADPVSATVPASTVPGEYQVVVTNSNGVDSPLGATLTVGYTVNGVEYGKRNLGGNNTRNNGYLVHRVAAGGSIQAAIDAAAAGDLILVAPGIYDELVIMWKPVKLQGWGAAVTSINARQVPTEKITDWRAKVQALVDNGDIDLLPGQEQLPGFPGLGAALFPTEEGAGIFVAGIEQGGTNSNRFDVTRNKRARIDGFTVLGASTGGGIIVNGYAGDLVVGNNWLTANGGFYGGGIRVGHPDLSHEENGNAGLVYDDAVNDRIRIHRNHIAKNGGQLGAGGGISLHTGADDYRVQQNWVCGNFSQGSGGGIGHLGLSDNGLIEDNVVIFNESFSQANPTSGGGIFIGGQPGLVAGAPSPGAGNVVVDGNLVRGNLAGAGDGGGIRIASVNGAELIASNGGLTDPADWYGVQVYNNMVNNNVAGLAGGGISVEDSLKVDIRHNTVANNDSTATTALAFEPGAPNISVAQPAGIVSRVHSTVLAGIVGAGFSDPVLSANIVHQNRSFYWLNYDDPATAVIETGLFPSNCPPGPNGEAPTTCDLTNVAGYTYDLAVLNGRDETTDLLSPTYALLTDTPANDPYLAEVTNIIGNPAFVNGYLNVGRDSTLLFPESTVLQTAGAFDEGGNFLQVAFGPLSLVAPDTDPANAEGPLFDYHLGGGSAAIDTGGTVSATSLDIDNENRPQGTGVDIGADETQ